MQVDFVGQRQRVKHSPLPPKIFRTEYR